MTKLDINKKIRKSVQRVGVQRFFTGLIFLFAGLVWKFFQVTDDGSKVTLPQSDVNTNGVRLRTPGEYREWVFTSIPLQFQWDEVNPTHLIVEVG